MTDWTSLLTAIRRGWWRHAAPVTVRPDPVVRPESRIRGVPAEYLSLCNYLEQRYATVVVLTFEQVEALLGFALPAVARTEREWWTGTAVQTGSHRIAWTGTGRTAAPNLPARTVTFERSA